MGLYIKECFQVWWWGILLLPPLTPAAHRMEGKNHTHLLLCPAGRLLIHPIGVLWESPQATSKKSERKTSHNSGAHTVFLVLCNYLALSEIHDNMFVGVCVWKTTNQHRSDLSDLSASNIFYVPEK